MCFRTHRHSRMAILPNRSRSSQQKDPSDNIVHNVSEPSSPTVGGPLQLECKAFKRTSNHSRSDKSAERRDLDQPRRTDSDRTRPETHQNLIHSNKEQRHPTGWHPRVEPKGHAA
jgi:hypothetical protein